MTRPFVIPDRYREGRDWDAVDDRRQEALDDVRNRDRLVAWYERRPAPDEFEEAA